MKGFLLSMLLCAATLGAMAQEARKFTINGHLTDVTEVAGTSLSEIPPKESSLIPNCCSIHPNLP